VETLQRKNEDLLKENEKLRSERNFRKQQYMHGSNPPQSANPYSSQAPAGSKYGGLGFGQHLHSKLGNQVSNNPAINIASKENMIANSQIFTSGSFGGNPKGLQQSSEHSDSFIGAFGKPDPYTLPF
jgi:hypothetical protein